MATVGHDFKARVEIITAGLDVQRRVHHGATFVTALPDGTIKSHQADIDVVVRCHDGLDRILGNLHSCYQPCADRRVDTVIKVVAVVEHQVVVAVCPDRMRHGRIRWHSAGPGAAIYDIWIARPGVAVHARVGITLDQVGLLSRIAGRYGLPDLLVPVVLCELVSVEAVLFQRADGINDYPLVVQVDRGIAFIGGLQKNVFASTGRKITARSIVQHGGVIAADISMGIVISDRHTQQCAHTARCIHHKHHVRLYRRRTQVGRGVNLDIFRDSRCRCESCKYQACRHRPQS